MTVVKVKKYSGVFDWVLTQLTVELGLITMQQQFRSGMVGKACKMSFFRNPQTQDHFFRDPHPSSVHEGHYQLSSTKELLYRKNQKTPYVQKITG